MKEFRDSEELFDAINNLYFRGLIKVLFLLVLKEI